MFGSSMLMTVGHALDRAKDDGLLVKVYVGGEWITGRVVNNDGHGVALVEENGDLCVLRADSITGVRMPHVVETRHTRSERADPRAEEPWTTESRVSPQHDLALIP